MRKPRQFFCYLNFIAYPSGDCVFPGLSNVLSENHTKDLSFEQLSRLIILYLQEKHNKPLCNIDDPENTFVNMTVKDLWFDFYSWWIKLGDKKRKFVLSRNVHIWTFMNQTICPRCEMGVIKAGKAQKIGKKWKYPKTCSNRECSFHNNTKLGLEP